MGHFGQRKTPGENMKLFEKMCYKAGLKFGTAVYGQNMSAEEKRQLERQLYQQKLQEESGPLPPEGPAAPVAPKDGAVPTVITL